MGASFRAYATACARFDGRDDALRPRQIFKGAHRLLVGDGHILRPPDVVQVSVLRPNAGIVQSGGDGVYRSDLAVLVLTEVGLHAMKDAQAAGGDGGGGLKGVHPAPGGFTADQTDGRVRNKVVEAPDRVGPAAHAGDHRVRQAALPLQQLAADLLRDHRLEIAHDGGEGVRPP